MSAAVDERRARIFDDLRDLIEGDLYLEPLDRAPYAHDASIYEIDPLGAIAPRTEDDVVTAIRYAAGYTEGGATVTHSESIIQDIE